MDKVKLPSHLDRLTDPDLDLRRVQGMVRVGDEVVFVALSGRAQAPLFKLTANSDALAPIEGFESVASIRPGDEHCALVESEGAIWRVDLAGDKARLLDLPKGVVSCDVRWHAQGLIVVALVDRRPSVDPDAPYCYPAPRGEITLCRYASTEGWRDLAQVVAGCSGLSMCRNGRRIAWREPLNVVPEEAQRAEFCGFDLDAGEARRLTEGAGKAGRITMATDGSGYLYEANYEAEYPITTHADVWWTSWDGNERTNLTKGGQCVARFGWGHREKTAWVSVVQGLEIRTKVLALDSAPVGELDADAVSDIVWMRDGRAVFETEDRERFPAIWTGTRRIPLPQPENCEGLRVSQLAWKAPDAWAIEGVLYEADDTPRPAPLLVSAHGGPAAPVENVRSEAARYRHLLRAGYRVFRPAFRGSLGFGDDFARGNIGCQGRADLHDIISGVDFLIDEGIATPNQVGIFGGSYGGYLTLQALATTDRFRAGVALYGFIDIRRMTLETGDFTYETEYLQPISWPITERTRISDVFPHLGAIRAPLLLLHGDRDPICPLSESKVTYRALEALGVPVGLVVYPGEGHGFRKANTRRDSARRTLAWFLEYLPPPGP